MLPHGLHVVGAFSSTGAAGAAPAAAPGSSHVAAVLSSEGCSYRVNGAAVEAVAAAHAVGGTAPDGITLPGFMALRCQAEVLLHVCLRASPASDWQRALQQGFDEAEASLLPHGRDLVFLAGGGPGADAAGTLITSAAPGSMQDALSSAASSSAEGLVTVQPLLDTTSGSGAAPHAPVFCFTPAQGAAGSSSSSSSPGTLSSAVLGLDVLCYVPCAAPAASVPARLQQALRQQLRRAQAILQQHGSLVPLRAYHFAPPGLGTPITVLYPSLAPAPEECERRLLPLRQNLHALLGLPLDRPLLRLANALDLAGPRGGGGGIGEWQGAAAAQRARDAAYTRCGVEDVPCSGSGATPAAIAACTRAPAACRMPLHHIQLTTRA